jgi:hypothetical protein
MSDRSKKRKELKKKYGSSLSDKEYAITLQLEANVKLLTIINPNNDK